MKDAEIFRVQYIAPDGTIHDRAPETTFAVAVTNERQWDAAIAAAEVQKAGGNPTEQIQAARKAYFAMSENKKPEPVSNPVPDPEQTVENDMLRRYLIAVANLNAGKFQDLSTAELLDVCLVAKTPVVGMEEWANSISSLVEAARNKKE